MKKLLATLPLLLSIACVAQDAAPKTVAKPVTGVTKTAAPAQPWTKIPIPPLHAFKPAEPKRIDLSNGLVIFLQEDHELPFIHGSILIRGGGRDEPSNKVGMVSLYGSTWRTSGTGTESGDVLDDKLAAKAASIETSGSFASTTLRWSSLKNDFDSTFASAMDLLLHPNFQQDKLELAKRRMEAGIARRNDDSSAIASREALQLVYGKSSPYARSTEYATVEAVMLNDLKDWHKRTVVPNGMILSVSGDFDSAAMEAKLRAALGNLPRGEAIAPLHESFPGPKPGVYFVNKEDIDQSSVFIVGIGTQRDNPDYYALSVMNEVFSGGFGSRLFQTVRTKLGLAYSVGGAYSTQYDHPGIFYSEAGTKSVSTVAATKAILDQVNRLKSDPPTASEMKRAKDDVLNSFVFEYDTPEKVLGEQVILAFYGYPPDFLAKFKAGVEGVTAADISRVANKYIDQSKLAILVVGNGAEIDPRIETLGAVTPLDITIPARPGAATPPQRPAR